MSLAGGPARLSEYQKKLGNEKYVNSHTNNCNTILEKHVIAFASCASGAEELIGSLLV